MPPPFSLAQAEFIKKTCQAIDSTSNYFDNHDWSNIVPTGGSRSSLTKSISADSFYVRPVAVWKYQN